MTAVSLGRAGSGESYRIERVYLDAEQTYGREVLRWWSQFRQRME